ncbi:MAG: FAD binding domain-containing protein [Terrisporobacter sp.]|uniref:FAD binding domain-containing protein n=1 Tax=Terrisporobacter sp. TaxID=1965305 RepID=UPI002FCA405A
MFTLIELVQPESLEEAYEILSKRKNNIVIGGSAFLRMGQKRIGTGIDLSNLNLNLIEESEDYIEIGAMTTLRDLEVSPILNKYFDQVISKSVKDIIGIQFRNVVTVGGSVFSKYGFSDLIVGLLALDTEVELYKGGRMSLEEFLNKKYEKDILVKLHIKKNNASALYKCMRNSRSDYPILNVSVSKSDNSFKICVGARPQRATIAKEASDFISSNILNEENIIKASEIASKELVFGSNMRASKEYREAICKSLVKNALMEVSSC